MENPANPDLQNNSEESPSGGTHPVMVTGGGLRFHPLGFAILALAGIFILYQLVGGGLSLLLIGGSLTEENVYLVRLITVVNQILFLLIPTLFLLKYQHGKISAAIPLRMPGIAESILVAVSIVALLQVLNGYIYFQDQIPMPSSIKPLLDAVKKMIEETYRILVESRSFPEMMWVMVVVSLTPSICEELLFRGLIQKNFSSAFDPKTGFILTGVIFGLYHLNPFLVVPLVVLGIYFSFLVYRSKSIFVAVLAHFINNGISTVGAYVDPIHTDQPWTEMVQSTEPTGTLTVLSFVGIFALLFLISHYYYMRVTSNIQGQELRA
jgi:membrane protease YdiL (CAAX protease family)